MLRRARPVHPLARLPLLLALLGTPLAVHAREGGIATLGATGGLTIPSAHVLDSGSLALSAGNYQDPQFGPTERSQNYTVGFGLLPGLELFGRFADYTNGRNLFEKKGGIRDISANLKWQLPLEVEGLPRFALGISDLEGGSNHFESQYLVASDTWNWLSWSLGYAHSTPSSASRARVLDGVFGGVELHLAETGASLLAETDGIQQHAGIRYRSEPLPWLADARVVGTLQRSFGAENRAGQGDDATSFNVSLVVPLGADEKTRRQRIEAGFRPLPALDAKADGLPATREDRLDQIARALRASGLDRVRTGTLNDVLVIEYENQRYLHNEVDALGVVLSLAAELAPAGVKQVRAVSRKVGLAVAETTVSLDAWRRFLRDGFVADARDSLEFRRGARYNPDQIAWASGAAGQAERKNWLKLELGPMLNYALGTEFGAFDYSLAANLRAAVPLWAGAELYSDVVQRLDTSQEMEADGVFADSSHRNGLRTLALQQSFWLDKRVFASLGAGVYNYDYLGAEGEAIGFLPWNGDTVHLRGTWQRASDEGNRPREIEAYAAIYRWQFNPKTWIEGGYQQYTDTSRGPSLAFTRWFGDVSVSLFGRRGGDSTFAGLEFSLPLTPRQGMKAAPLQFAGKARYMQPIRTRLTSSGQRANAIAVGSVRPVAINHSAELALLNSGRLDRDYLASQLQRMRESFFLYARSQLD